jgi:hypothetical protein
MSFMIAYEFLPDEYKSEIFLFFNKELYVVVLVPNMLAGAVAFYL